MSFVLGWGGVIMENILEVKNLRKYFQGNSGLIKNKSFLKAVDDVSFTIEKGKIMALVGESGCGKSTTGKVILNLYKATGGMVRFEDKTLFNMEEKVHITEKEMMKLRKDMQIIFQDPYSSLNSRKSIEYIVSEGIIKHKLTDSKRQCRELVVDYLDLCGISEDSLTKYPHEFSGGQRQRIGIARALAIKPKFIVCDEITSALDLSVQAQILNLMLDLKEKFNLTYLFISHNLSIVRSFSDEVGVMYLGSLVEKGNTKEIFKEALHPYTKALISSVPKSHPLDKRERIILTGDIPSALKVPNGCKFHTRCPYAKEKCKNEIPLLKKVKDNRFVACHLY